ncbi:hypothetical protein [Desulfocurvus sp. DL9XJH121]
MLILGLFFPAAISVVILIASGYFLFPQIMASSTFSPNPDTFLREEIEVILKYPLFFKYPFGSRSISAFLSGLQFFVALPVAGMLIYREQYPFILAAAATFFICLHLRPKLDPVFFLNEAKSRAKDPSMFFTFARELTIIESILFKLDPRNEPQDDEA